MAAVYPRRPAADDNDVPYGFAAHIALRQCACVGSKTLSAKRPRPAHYSGLSPPLVRATAQGLHRSWDQSSGLQLFRGSARALVQLRLRCSSQYPREGRNGRHQRRAYHAPSIKLFGSDPLARNGLITFRPVPDSNKYGPVTARTRSALTSLGASAPHVRFLAPYAEIHSTGSHEEYRTRSVVDGSPLGGLPSQAKRC